MNGHRLQATSASEAFQKWLWERIHQSNGTMSLSDMVCHIYPVMHAHCILFGMHMCPAVKVELLRKLIKTDDPELNAENEEVTYTATSLPMHTHVVNLGVIVAHLVPALNRERVS